MLLLTFLVIARSDDHQAVGRRTRIMPRPAQERYNPEMPFRRNITRKLLDGHKPTEEGPGLSDEIKAQPLVPIRPHFNHSRRNLTKGPVFHDNFLNRTTKFNYSFPGNHSEKIDPRKKPHRRPVFQPISEINQTSNKTIEKTDTLPKDEVKPENETKMPIIIEENQNNQTKPNTTDISTTTVTKNLTLNKNVTKIENSTNITIIEENTTVIEENATNSTIDNPNITETATKPVENESNKTQTETTQITSTPTENPQADFIDSDGLEILRGPRDEKHPNPDHDPNDWRFNVPFVVCGPNAYNTSNYACQCNPETPDGDPYSDTGCFKCTADCSSWAICNPDNTCRCIYGYEGNGTYCESSTIRLLTIKAHTNKTLIVSHIFQSDGHLKKLYCKFQDRIVNAFYVSDNISMCKMPEDIVDRFEFEISVDPSKFSGDSVLYEIPKKETMRSRKVMGIIFVIAMVVVTIFLMNTKQPKKQVQRKVVEQKPKPGEEDLDAMGEPAPFNDVDANLDDYQNANASDAEEDDSIYSQPITDGNGNLLQQPQTNTTTVITPPAIYAPSGPNV